LIATGGHDNNILVWTLDSLEPLYTLTGHTGAVCSLVAGKFGTLLSGSWDNTAKVWINNKCVMTLKGHEAAVWSVELMPDHGLMLTDHIYITFTRIHYFHSIAVFPNDSGRFASVGEDRSLRIWEGGECCQTITLPAQSVWCVECLENGDIVTGSSDGVARVFTSEPDRFASQEEIKLFEQEVASQVIPAQTSGQIGDIKLEQLPGPEALLRPGKKSGQTIMVRRGQTVECHQWNEMEGKWDKVGEVVGAPGTTTASSGDKSMYKGKINPPFPLTLPLSPAIFTAPLFHYPYLFPCLFPCPVPLPCSPAPSLFPCPVPLPCSPALFPFPVPLPCSPSLFPCPVPLPCSPSLFPFPVPLPCSPSLFPCPVPLPLPCSPALFLCPVPLPCSPALFPCPVSLPCSPALFPCPVPLPCSPVLFPCPVPLPCSPALFPCPVPLPCSPALFPCPVPLPCSPVLFPCPVPLPCSPALFPCPVPLPCSPALFPFPCLYDPWVAAHGFLAVNDLSQLFLDQVVDFIIKNTQDITIGQVAPIATDPFTGGARYVPGSAPGTGSGNQLSRSGGGAVDPFTGWSYIVP
ncbi:hypothetical protein QZH41_008412, partial [Actinostola sp. cb2023]